MFNISGRFKLWQENQRIASLRQQSNLKGALQVADRARDLAAQIHGVNHPHFALSLNNLASILFQLGAYEEADPIFSQAIGIWRNANKTNSPYFAALLNNAGETKRMLNKNKEAVQIHEEGLAIRKKYGRPVEYAQSLYNLACAYKALGNTDKAKMLYEIALNLRSKALGKNHPDTIKTINALANFK